MQLESPSKYVLSAHLPNEKDALTSCCSSQKGSTAHRLVHDGNLAGLTGGDVFFWQLERLAGESNIANCPLCKKF